MRGIWTKRIALGVWLATAVFAHAADVSSPSDLSPRLARVKDVSSVEGIRDNQLIGYGIVVGLHNTGDSSQTVFPVQTLLSTLQRMGVNLQGNSLASTMQVRNMAAVFIAATLPPFAEPGTKLDVTVSSAGDARSLEGGLLLMSPLYGPDGRIYAQAQGPLVLGGYSVQANGNSKSVNDPTTGIVPDGAMVERAVPVDLADLRPLTLLLDNADFRTAEQMADAINHSLGKKVATAVDGRRVTLTTAPGEDIAALLARVQAVEVQVYPKAIVVVNERTGTVVIGGQVRLQPVTILHGGLTVTVQSHLEVSQPGPLSSGTTQVVRQTTINAQDKPANQIVLKNGATVQDLVASLQQIGATARDIISILQAMKQAQALEADLEVQ
ncbi:MULTISPECIES: flagellar basal body P-ring protein FlgI [Acidobacterium]|uniref:Flagellar P-ring protein n=1 Tax=Acidobacterium capsulatum (strain ATCC 51196 / DSM 11244 / BCRC 80197 / JCM 7670 / NBRC 15755 / NCIMB 13165 / 161) TaxID=240015 RepID=C1F9A4_ACIC5|nr:flagellar P-ring protein FlgI [Acidobacterium capsulatum ATCC 51196]